MKKILLTIFLIAGIAVFANAQDTTKVKKTPQERAAQMTKALQRKLNLTADQTTQVSAILTDEATKTSDIKEKGVKGHGLAKLEAKTDADKKINAILTPDQQKVYAQMEEKMKAKAQERLQARKTAQATPPAPPAPPAQ